MRHARLQDMVKGWFVGDFSPAVMRSTDCEVAVKHYAAGDHEAVHHHRVATEITLIVSGEVEMMGRRWSAGDIVVVEPGEATDFVAHTDAVNVVVKLPSAAGDKYMGVMPTG
jgi:mannose-6-phosphate isomerase-like protein (cupin superfamily)